MSGILGPVLVLFSIGLAIEAAAAQAPLEFLSASEFVKLPYPLPVDADGKLRLPLTNWTKERDPEGTDLLLAKDGDAKAAIMREDGGQVEALIAYRLRSAASGEAKSEKKNEERPEDSYGFFFKKGKLAAVTTCEDAAIKSSLGRICVTATAKLCSNLRSGAGVDVETLGEVETFETRALASILTLRGSDHQLENVVKSGNRLGLKSALQTTKGQLMALAKQIAKELGHSPPETESKSALEQRQIEARAKADSLHAKNVLEKSLPRLKESCRLL